MATTIEKVKTIVTDRPNEIERPIEPVKVSPGHQILVRFVRTWLQAFLGFAGLLVVGALVVDPANWMRWLEPAFLLDLGQRVAVCAIVATAVGLVSLAQNALEFLGRVDAEHPKWRA